MAILSGLHVWPETIEFMDEILDFDHDVEDCRVAGIVLHRYVGREENPTIVERTHDGRLFPMP